VSLKLTAPALLYLTGITLAAALRAGNKQPVPGLKWAAD